MSVPATANPHKVLMVDDDEAILDLTTRQLVRKGYEVVAAASVTEALRYIATDSFDALITDLNMPNAGDGFTLVTAMRHSQPDALILLVSGYPDVERAMATIALQADEIIVKPFDTASLAGLLSEKLVARKPAVRAEKQRVSAILERCLPDILTDWLAEAKLSSELNHLNLSDDERTGYLSETDSGPDCATRQVGQHTAERRSTLFAFGRGTWEIALPTGVLISNAGA